MFELHGLAKASSFLGAEKGYVQGGGGNTSIKSPGMGMWIKASGMTLGEAGASLGFVRVNDQLLREEVLSCNSEADYNALLARSVLEDTGGRRPSIETGLHALMGVCVLHTHSVWANILSCSAEGPQILATLFPDSLWVPYQTPGLPLTRAVAERVQQAKPSIIFLQNHGLLVSGESASLALELHESVNAVIRSYLQIDLEFPLASPVGQIPEGILFPDQAVFHCRPDLAASLAGQETQQAYEFLCHNIPRCGLSLNFLTETDVDVLVNLESEKYRQKVAQQQ